MAISRGQIPSLLEPGLGRNWGKKTRKQFKVKAPNVKGLSSYYDDLYKKPSSKKVKVQKLQVKSDTIKKVVQQKKA